MTDPHQDLRERVENIIVEVVAGLSPEKAAIAVIAICFPWQPLDAEAKDGNIYLFKERWKDGWLVSTGYWESGARGLGEWMGFTSLLSNPTEYMPLPPEPSDD